MQDKVALWEELANIKQAQQNSTWCIIGDFNAVRNGNEKKGVRIEGIKKREIKRFNNFIENNFLLDMPIVGRKYMWYKTNGTTKSILDRALVMRTSKPKGHAQKDWNIKIK